MRPRRVALYGDVDLKYIDGSTVWLTSLCSVLQMVDRVDVDLILKAPIQRDVLTSELGAGVRLHEPAKVRSHDNVIQALADLDASDPFDVLIVRGRRIAHRIVQDGRFASRMWAYLTDVPQDRYHLHSPEGDELRSVLSGASRLLCQTEDMRAWFASVAPRADEKLLLLPPMVPDAAFRPRERGWMDDGLRLLYAGKFAPDWGFVEVVEQLAVLRERGVDLTLVVAGDKIHDPPDDPAFAPSVRKALEAEFVDWTGGVRRSEVFRLLHGVDLALSIRTSALDDSRELSTKLLEYSAAGVPVVANRTLAHVELFGDDYPFLVSDFSDLQAVVETVVSRPDVVEWASKRVREVAGGYTFGRAAEALEAALQQVPISRRRTGSRRFHILVVGHDLKFITPLIEGWRSEGLEVSVDQWTGHNRHDPQASLRLLREADLVVCEWMLGNADFYARNAPPGTPLLVRLHRMELTTEWPGTVPVDRIDRIITVSEHIKEELTSRFEIPPTKVVVIPNGVNAASYDRPKLEGAEHTLGMLGYLPRLKRLDRAVELLRSLRRVDRRYRLVVKGRRPEEANWIWHNNDERSYYEAVMADIRDSDLAEAVVFEPAGPDTPSWFRKIGYILSPSDLESFHVALFEGMASASVPVVWDRVGASGLVPGRWVHASTMDAAEWILAHDDGHREEGLEAADFVRQHFSLHQVQREWDHLLDSVVGEMITARGRSSDESDGFTSPEYETLVAPAIVDELSSLEKGLPSSAAPTQVPYRYSAGDPTEEDHAAVRRLLTGSFQPSTLFQPVAMTMPPDWASNPYGNRSWDFHRHSLEWLVPLIRVAKDDGAARESLEAIVESWIECNSRPPGDTPYVWNDHTSAIRTRVFLFLLYALDGPLEEGTRNLVRASLIQHGAFLADGRHYTPDSNHGLEMDASLLALSVSQPHLKFAPVWKDKAEKRLEAYLAHNYSQRFLHLEQSPAYHLFVTVRLMSVVSFLRENGMTVPARLERVVRGAAAAWPYIRRPDGSAPMIGDTPSHPKPTDLGPVHERLLGRSPRSIAPESMLNPRDDGATAFVDERAGYALYSDDFPAVTVGHDRRTFHVTVKCNTFESPHYHHDAGSFVVWYEGLDWIVDSGYYSMEEETPERKYMRSARAHNVLLVDDEDFEFRPFRVADVFRSQSADGIEMLHDLGPVLHRRRISVIASQRLVVVRDHVSPTEEGRHTITQLLHLHPQLTLDVRSPDEVVTQGPNDQRLVITHEGSGATEMSVQAGDEDGRAIGWYSEEYMDRQPASVLRWNSMVEGEGSWTIQLCFA